MKKSLKLSGIITLILGFVSFSWLIFDFNAFEFIRPKMINFEKLGPVEELLGLAIWIGLLVSFFFHLSAILTIILQLRFFKKVNTFRLITLLVGIISFITIIGDFAALQDIGTEYKFGLSTQGEWALLYLALIPHALFHVLMFILIFTTFHALRDQYQPEFVTKDEIIFITAQYVGILCGIIGLGFTSLYAVLQVPLWCVKPVIVPFSIFIIMPYGLIASYWLIMKRKEKVSEWYDEKQFRDVTKAGFTTLLVTLPWMTIIFIINYLATDGTMSILWFPIYLFLVLLIFSGGILYFSKKG